MGQLLEGAIRREGLNISDVAVALNINRRTLYNWFKQEVLDEHKLLKVSEIIRGGLPWEINEPAVILIATEQPFKVNDELYWQEKYIDLLDRYTRLLKNKKP